MPAAGTPPSPALCRVITRRGVLRAGLIVSGASGLVLSGTAAWAGAEAAYELVVTRYALRPPRWPTGQRLGITVLADLHAGGPNMGIARVRQVVDRANSLDSDLVVILGDYGASHPFVTEVVPHGAWAAELARLRAPLGVFAILGNHDWWSDIAGIRRALLRERMPLLENDAVPLRFAGGRIWLAGLGDQLSFRLGDGRYRGTDDLPGTLNRIQGDEPAVLLAHEPEVFSRVPDRVALTLAGHTHGGQVRLPGVSPCWIDACHSGRYVYGHFVEGGRHMVVSGGLGCSKLPVRIGVPPEIVQVVLGA
jgi:predicted MPP superfamily phosphohydrolase